MNTYFVSHKITDKYMNTYFIGYKISWKFEFLTMPFQSDFAGVACR